MAYYYATHSGRFCAVVAINGRADWVMQAQYDADGLLPGPMGTTPQKDSALYRAASPVANARAVRVPMLLVGGQKDMQLLVANVTTMADSLSAHGKAFESIIFSDEGHQIDLPLNRARLLDATRRTLRKGCGV
jgi:dipeptidyl aminopeptidase/acylaminoacyl peptidase